MYDKNGDGRISKGELMLTMQLIGANPTKDEVEKMIREVDTDGNSYFHFLFLTPVSRPGQSYSGQRMAQ